MSDNPPQDGTLRSLTKSGKPPETRLKDAREARSVVEGYVQSDRQQRSWKRSRVQGLIDGNPPYNSAEQRKAGRGLDANVNWGIARSYLEAALSAFYDIFSEASTYATCKTYHYADSYDQADEWSGIVTEEFHCLQTEEESFDYDMQLSQHDMVLYGVGPMMFFDEFDYRAYAIRCGNLLVPDHAKSNTHRWECAAVLQDCLPHELYSYIRKPDSASSVGWNVAHTRKSIMNAHPLTEQGGNYRSWEWHQQALKNGSFYYSSQSKVVSLAHVLFKEFPIGDEVDGKISHKIILRNSMEDSKEEFLFENIGRFENWNQCIHPMYYDHGGGGEHYSVTGMGIKLFSAMELQNRILCDLADKVFAPKMLFKSTTAANKQKLSLLRVGSGAAQMPADFEFMQTQVAGFMQDGIGFNREISGVVASNMSQYRQNLQKESGNPMTASESNWRASEQSKLGKTQLNRYYDQLDYLYAEKYRRAINPDLTKSHPGGEKALEFQKRCKERGVPREALKKMKVKASRIVGQGSVYERQQSLEFLLGLVSMLPETGRDALLRQVIASRAGQSSVEVFYPKTVQSQRPTDHHAFAMLQVSSMKDGVPPIITPTQNPVIFAQTFLQAGSQALESVQQGGDPASVLAFLELVGPAVAAHLERIAQDPTRKEIYKLLFGQWKELAKATDELKAIVEQQMQEQQEQQQEMMEAQQQAGAILGGQDPKTMIEAAKVESKIGLDRIKTQSALQLKSQKALQGMAIADMQSAAKLRREAATVKANGE